MEIHPAILVVLIVTVTSMMVANIYLGLRAVNLSIDKDVLELELNSAVMSGALLANSLVCKCGGELSVLLGCVKCGKRYELVERELVEVKQADDNEDPLGWWFCTVDVVLSCHCGGFVQFTDINQRRECDRCGKSWEIEIKGKPVMQEKP